MDAGTSALRNAKNSRPGPAQNGVRTQMRNSLLNESMGTISLEYETPIQSKMAGSVRGTISSAQNYNGMQSYQQTNQQINGHQHIASNQYQHPQRPINGQYHPQQQAFNSNYQAQQKAWNGQPMNSIQPNQHHQYYNNGGQNYTPQGSGYAYPRNNSMPAGPNQIQNPRYNRAPIMQRQQQQQMAQDYVEDDDFDDASSKRSYSLGQKSISNFFKGKGHSKTFGRAMRFGGKTGKPIPATGVGGNGGGGGSGDEDEDEAVMMSDNSTMTFNDIKTLGNKGGDKYGYSGDTAPIIPTIFTKGHDNMSSTEYRKHMMNQKKMAMSAMAKQQIGPTPAQTNNGPRSMSLQSNYNPIHANSQMVNRMQPPMPMPQHGVRSNTLTTSVPFPHNTFNLNPAPNQNRYKNPSMPAQHHVQNIPPNARSNMDQNGVGQGRSMSLTTGPTQNMKSYAGISESNPNRIPDMYPQTESLQTSKLQNSVIHQPDVAMNVDLTKPVVEYNSRALNSSFTSTNSSGSTSNLLQSNHSASSISTERDTATPHITSPLKNKIESYNDNSKLHVLKLSENHQSDIMSKRNAESTRQEVEKLTAEPRNSPNDIRYQTSKHNTENEALLRAQNNDEFTFYDPPSYMRQGQSSSERSSRQNSPEKNVEAFDAFAGKVVEPLETISKEDDDYLNLRPSSLLDTGLESLAITEQLKSQNFREQSISSPSRVSNARESSVTFASAISDLSAKGESNNTLTGMYKLENATGSNVYVTAQEFQGSQPEDDTRNNARNSYSNPSVHTIREEFVDESSTITNSGKDIDEVPENVPAEAPQPPTHDIDGIPDSPAKKLRQSIISASTSSPVRPLNLGSAAKIDNRGIYEGPGAVYQPIYAEAGHDTSQMIVIPETQLNLLTENKSLMQEITVLSSELAESIQREIHLENRLMEPNAAYMRDDIQNGQLLEEMEAKLRYKSSRILELIQQLNDERMKRFIAEEQLVFQKEGKHANVQELIYENTELKRALKSTNSP